LRILESGEYEKLGSGKTMTCGCRVLAATNRNLKTMMNAGKFREDLFYRLNVIGIPVLPLRKRVEDIPALLDYFLEEIGAQDDFRFTAEAIGLMASYEWPGNVRHLKNFVQQVTFNCQPGEIGVDTVENVYYQGDFSGAEIFEKGNRLTAAIRQFEIGFLSRLKQKHQGNISAMARELQMDRGNLSKKLKQLGIV
jgi:two-component system nitrogen regulation response regulator NtrX